MRGRGRVFRPTSGHTGDKVAVWSLDFTVKGCRCGKCDSTGRHRQPTGLPSRREAEELLEHRRRDYQNGRYEAAPPTPRTLRAYAEHHLAAKAQETDRHGQPITVQWLAAVKQHLDRAVVFFGTERLLGSIARADLLKWITVLGRQFKGGAARQHLNSLSNLYRRGMADGFVTVNPVSTLLPTEKPKGAADEADWLEVPEAALLVEAAKHYEPKRDDLGMPFAYPLIATMLLTGGRLAEVLGLEVDDVSLERKTVTFRPNKWRRLKTKRSHRAVPLWPQLEQILRAYFPEREQMGGGTLLFPSFRTGQEAMLTDIRKLVDAVAKRAGWKSGEITPKMFRHTYISARIQTTQNGAPVAAFTVAREVGHSSTAMIEKVYGHLGQIQHRSEVVEYRVRQHRKAIARLRRTLQQQQAKAA